MDIDANEIMCVFAVALLGFAALTTLGYFIGHLFDWQAEGAKIGAATNGGEPVFMMNNKNELIKGAAWDEATPKQKALYDLLERTAPEERQKVAEDYLNSSGRQWSEPNTRWAIKGNMEEKP